MMFLNTVKGVVARKETSYRKLESATGISFSHIRRVIEKERPLPRDPDFIIKICKALDLRPEDFPEYRERIMTKAVEDDPELRDEMFKKWLDKKGVDN